MQRDKRAEFAFSVTGKKRFQGAFAAVAGVLAGNFLNFRDEIGIKGQTGAAKRHQGNIGGSVGSGRKHACGRPRGFTSGILPVEKRDVQAVLRKPQRDSTADDARADHYDIVGAHRGHFTSRRARELQRGRRAREAEAWRGAGSTWSPRNKETGRKNSRRI